MVQVLENRDKKVIKFEKLSEQKLKLLESEFCDVSKLRTYLLEQKLTSVDLVNFFGARIMTVGREHNYTADEMFASAMEMAI